MFSVKTGEVGNVLILNESTAQALIKEKLFRKQDSDSNYIIDTLQIPKRRVAIIYK